MIDTIGIPSPAIDACAPLAPELGTMRPAERLASYHEVECTPRPDPSAVKAKAAGLIEHLDGVLGACGKPTFTERHAP